MFSGIRKVCDNEYAERKNTNKVDFLKGDRYFCSPFCKKR